ncbi:MAG: hypothetical protein JF590_06770, partial [Gemmatimonadetes bacterium]|nr:hypothetical protein [Gemmatimonadota bacterium]
MNPLGVKADYAISGDGNEDGAWNGIWDVATQIDSLGWTAEYRIPFSQLRFARGNDVTFGFSVWRMLQRHTEQMTWPLYRQSKSGFTSQFGDLTGLTGLAQPERFEIAPYVLTQNEPDRATGGIDRNQVNQVGGDLKYAIAPNITLNATVNPDFGQVEADPSVLNLGAAKVTGRFSNGTSFGLMDAYTERVHNSIDQTMEPATNYSVLRVNRDFDRGNGSIGVMGTAVNRAQDQWSTPYLHDAAYSGGLDARRRVGRYEFSGSLMGSTVTGSKEAILRTQTQPAHYFQRPDDGIALDSNATSLSGNSLELRFAKVGGVLTHFETGYARRSAGFETNDIGFLYRADQQTWTNWFTFRWNKPNKVFQRLNWNMNYWMYWTLDGLPEERSFNTNFHTQLNNRWWVHLGGTQGLGQVYCARGCTRGGPALKVEPAFSPWGGLQSDERKQVTTGIWFNYNRADGGRSHFFSTSPWVALKVSSRFRSELDVNYARNHDDSQFYGNFTDAGTTHFTFAELKQRELGLTWRIDYTFTPNASFQLYASPFISKGTYS